MQEYKDTQEHQTIRQFSSNAIQKYTSTRKIKAPGVFLEPTRAVLEPTSAVLEHTGAVLEPTDAVLEPTGAVLEPTRLLYGYCMVIA